MVVAKFRGGKINNLEDIEIKGWYLLFLAALTQFILSVFKKNDYSFLQLSFDDYFFYIHGISYILIIICVLLNIKKLYMKIFLIGVILNFIVIFSNGGQMPVDLNKIEKAHIEEKLNISEFDIKHKAIDENTSFKILSDVILIPPPYPLIKILSIGDLFLMVGIFVFFQSELVKRPKDKEENSL